MNNGVRPRGDAAAGDPWDAALAVFEALAKPGRLGIFRAIVRAGPEGVSATQLVRRLRTTGSALTFHLRALSKVGLIRADSSSNWEGERSVMLTADFGKLDQLIALLRDETFPDVEPSSPADLRRR